MWWCGPSLPRGRSLRSLRWCVSGHPASGCARTHPSASLRSDLPSRPPPASAPRLPLPLPPPPPASPSLLDLGVVVGSRVRCAFCGPPQLQDRRVASGLSGGLQLAVIRSAVRLGSVLRIGRRAASTLRPLATRPRPSPVRVGCRVRAFTDRPELGHPRPSCRRSGPPWDAGLVACPFCPPSPSHTLSSCRHYCSRWRPTTQRLASRDSAVALRGLTRGVRATRRSRGAAAEPVRALTGPPPSASCSPRRYSKSVPPRALERPVSAALASSGGSLSRFARSSALLDRKLEWARRLEAGRPRREVGARTQVAVPAVAVAALSALPACGRLALKGSDHCPRSQPDCSAARLGRCVCLDYCVAGRRASRIAGRTALSCDRIDRCVAGRWVTGCCGVGLGLAVRGSAASPVAAPLDYGAACAGRSRRRLVRWTLRPLRRGDAGRRVAGLLRQLGPRSAGSLRRWVRKSAGAPGAGGWPARGRAGWCPAARGAGRRRRPGRRPGRRSGRSRRPC